MKVRFFLKVFFFGQNRLLLRISNLSIKEKHGAAKCFSGTGYFPHLYFHINAQKGKKNMFYDLYYFF